MAFGQVEVLNDSFSPAAVLDPPIPRAAEFDCAGGESPTLQLIGKLLCSLGKQLLTVRAISAATAAPGGSDGWRGAGLCSPPLLCCQLSKSNISGIWEMCFLQDE